MRNVAAFQSLRPPGIRPESLVAGAKCHAAFATLRALAFSQAGKFNLRIPIHAERLWREFGVARDTELAARLAAVQPNAFASFARHFADETLVFFGWHGALWFPLFQFDRCDMSLLPCPACVAVELEGWMATWEPTGWFVRPHAALRDRPISLLCAQPHAVVEAARGALPANGQAQLQTWPA